MFEGRALQSVVHNRVVPDSLLRTHSLTGPDYFSPFVFKVFEFLCLEKLGR